MIYLTLKTNKGKKVAWSPRNHYLLLEGNYAEINNGVFRIEKVFDEGFGQDEIIDSLKEAYGQEIVPYVRAVFDKNEFEYDTNYTEEYAYPQWLEFPEKWHRTKMYGNDLCDAETGEVLKSYE